MAGSGNQKKNKKTNHTGQNRKKQSDKSVKRPAAEDTYSYSEIGVWVAAAVLLIVELGNFGLCGFINYVSQTFFGLFGVVEYVLPAAVILAIFFLYINEYKKRAVQKVLLGSGVLLCVGMIAQLATGVDTYSVKELFMGGFYNQTGGGLICGSLAYALHRMLGTIGTYILVCLLIVVCVVFFAEVSIIELIRGRITVTQQRQHRAREERRQQRKRSEDFEEITREDYPEPSDHKKKAVLDSISVLPAETDQGILPSKKSEKLPENEEVHEITMDFEVNLPGEHMDEFAVSEMEKPKPKKPAGKKRTIEKKKEKTKTEVPDSSAEEATTIQMENRTAQQTQTLQAKEVGQSDAQYRFPPLELLKRGKTQPKEKEEAMRQNAYKLQEVLKSFGVNVTMTNYSCGPSVTRYEMVPEQGVKVSKITGLADDIMMNLAAQTIRIEAPIPGKSAVGIEIPNSKRSAVGFRELIDTDKFIKHPSKLSFAVGKDIEGNVVVEDIAKMPHLLIAGATGSGKSVCTNTLIMSILYKARPDEVQMILIDPKQVELKVYNGIPHLLVPVVTDPKKAAGALNWAVNEMTSRYEKFAECNVRNIQGYNAKIEENEKSGRLEETQEKKMPQIVIIVDELADLMMVAKAEVEEAIVRLAQLARAAGIHLVIATQRPSVDVVTGLIKANIPSRIALSVSSGVDSRTIIDSVGAEKLLGNGDMLFYPTMYPKPVRVQGAYISDEEVMNVVEYLKAQNGETKYNEEITSQITSVSSAAVKIGNDAADPDKDEYFVQAGRFIIEKDKASIGMLQRMFKIGFNRAARIMDQLFEAGVVGPEEGTKPRQVLMTEEQFEAYLNES